MTISNFFKTAQRSSKTTLAVVFMLIFVLPLLIKNNNQSKQIQSKASEAQTSVSTSILEKNGYGTVKSNVYVTAYQHMGNLDKTVYNAKVVLKNKITGAQLGSGFTNKQGKSPTWTVAANTDIEIFLYPPEYLSNQYCGDYWTVNTGPYGNLRSQNMRIKGPGTVPCISEKPMSTPTPTPQTSGSYLSFPSYGIKTCNTRDLVCEYSQTVSFLNRTSQVLYKTTLYTTGTGVKKILYQGFDGVWTNGQSKSVVGYQPGQRVQVPIKLTLTRQDLETYEKFGQYTETLYIDGATCNPTSPPDCYFYGGYAFNITIIISQGLGITTPTKLR